MSYGKTEGHHLKDQRLLSLTLGSKALSDSLCVIWINCLFNELLLDMTNYEAQSVWTLQTILCVIYQTPCGSPDLSWAASAMVMKKASLPRPTLQWEQSLCTTGKRGGPSRWPRRYSAPLQRYVSHSLVLSHHLLLVCTLNVLPQRLFRSFALAWSGKGHVSTHMAALWHTRLTTHSAVLFLVRDSRDFPELVFTNVNPVNICWFKNARRCEWQSDFNLF